jgi:hypothetical protein
MEQQSSGISNGDLKTRLTQIVVLLIAILIGILISSSVGAQDQFHRAKEKHFKTRYKTQIRQADNVCTILTKKRMQKPKAQYFAFLNRKPKYKPQAEIDTPANRN